MPSPRGTRFPWHTVLVVVLTAGLIAVFVRSIDLHEAGAAIVDADPAWILAALAATAVTYVIRALRWQALLRPIGHARFRTAFRTTVIGFAANALLPARPGEVLRPYLLAQRERLNPAAAFATVIVERLLDLCTVLLLFAVALLVVPSAISPQVKTAGWLAAAGGGVGLALLFVLAGHPERLGEWVERVTRRLPAKPAATVTQFARTFAQGLKVMRSPWHLASAMGWSISLWLSISVGILFTSWAFDLTISFVGSFLVTGYLTVGVSAPTPGGAGGFELAYQLALKVFYPGPETTSRIGAAAIALHVVSMGPVVVVGLLYMWQDGLTIGRLRGMQSKAKDAEEQ